MSFVFYDLETTGLSPHFDQIIQFAAIRTDHQLEEIDRFEIRSRLCSDVVPHPQALWINGVGIEQLIDSSLPSHYEMVGAIQAKLLSWSPSIFVGYNSLRFDEEFLRQALYKCLYPPYLTSNRECGRADVMNLALDAASGSPGAFVVPLDADGKRSFRLPDIARANGLTHGHAHDALSDVRATIELCNRLRRSAPGAWQRFARFSNKRAVADFIEGEDAFLLTTFVRNEACYVPLVWLGNDASQATLASCLVINAETTRLISASQTELAAAVARTPLLVRQIRTNKAPALTPMYDVDDSEVELDLGIEQIEEIGGAVRENAAFRMRLLDIMSANKREWPSETYVEKRIYEKFSSPTDQSIMAEFHTVDWSRRAHVLSRLSDDRMQTLGLRLLSRERPGMLSVEQHPAVAHGFARHPSDADGPLSVGRALELTADLIATLVGEDVSMLDRYRAYLEQRA